MRKHRTLPRTLRQLELTRDLLGPGRVSPVRRGARGPPGGGRRVPPVPRHGGADLQRLRRRAARPAPEPRAVLGGDPVVRRARLRRRSTSARPPPPPRSGASSRSGPTPSRTTATPGAPAPSPHAPSRWRPRATGSSRAAADWSRRSGSARPCSSRASARRSPTDISRHKPQSAFPEWRGRFG